MRTGIFQLAEGDRTALVEHLLRLSPQDRRLRFFCPAPDSVIHKFVERVCVEQVYGFFMFDDLVATSMVMPEDEGRIEFAVSVDVEHRGCGLARQLLDHGMHTTWAEHADQIVIRHACENLAMAALHKGLQSTQHLEAGEVDVVIDLEQMRQEQCDTMSRLMGEEL